MIIMITIKNNVIIVVVKSTTTIMANHCHFLYKIRFHSYLLQLMSAVYVAFRSFDIPTVAPILNLFRV